MTKKEIIQIVLTLFFMVVIVLVTIDAVKKDTVCTMTLLGLVLGGGFSFLDYQFRTKSAEKNSKVMQLVMLVFIFVIVAIGSVGAEIINQDNLGLKNGVIVFVIFFIVKELYEYILDGKTTIKEKSVIQENEKNV